MSEPIVLRRALKWAAPQIPERGRFLLCRVTPGRDWWDLDETLRTMPGRRTVGYTGPYHWHLIPMDLLEELETVTQSYPGRVVIHHTQ